MWSFSAAVTYLLHEVLPHAQPGFPEPAVSGRDQTLHGHAEPADDVPQLVPQVLWLQLPLADAQLGGRDAEGTESVLLEMGRRAQVKMLREAM